MVVTFCEYNHSHVGYCRKIHQEPGFKLPKRRAKAEKSHCICIPMYFFDQFFSSRFSQLIFSGNLFGRFFWPIFTHLFFPSIFTSRFFPNYFLPNFSKLIFQKSSTDQQRDRLHLNVYHHLSDFSDVFLLSAMDQIELFPPACKAAAPESIILDN